MPDFSSLIGGVAYNTPSGGPSGLFLSLDPKYQLAQNQAALAKQQLAQEQAFSGGLPTDQSGGTDWNAAAQRMYQLGAFDQGNNLISTGIRMSSPERPLDARQPNGPWAGGARIGWCAGWR